MAEASSRDLPSPGPHTGPTPALAKASRLVGRDCRQRRDPGPTEGCRRTREPRTTLRARRSRLMAHGSRRRAFGATRRRACTGPGRPPPPTPVQRLACQTASSRGACRPRRKEADRLAGLPQVPEDGLEPRTYEQGLAAVEQAGGEIDWDTRSRCGRPTRRLSERCGDSGQCDLRGVEPLGPLCRPPQARRRSARTNPRAVGAAS